MPINLKVYYTYKSYGILYLMKTLLIITNIPSPYRVDFFHYLQQHETDWEIHILFQAGNDSSFRQWNGGEEKLTNVHFLKSKVMRSTGFDITEKFISTGTAGMIGSIAPDVVVASEYNAAAISAKHWCSRHKIPYISWTDGTRYSERNIHLYQKLCRKYIIRNSSAYIASSTKSKENQIYLGAPAEKIYISSLTVDIDQYAGCGQHYDPDGPMLYVGSLVKRKGIDLMLAALEMLKDKKLKINIVGEGPEKENLQAQAAASGIADRVYFSGFRSGKELTEIYESSSLFILPTREDCFGLVTLEAMCCGLPVISSKYADGAYDLIETGKNGAIADPYNTEQFAAAIKKIMSDRALKCSMSEASREMSGKFRFEETEKGFMEAVSSNFAENCKR